MANTQGLVSCFWEEKYILFQAVLDTHLVLFMYKQWYINDDVTHYLVSTFCVCWNLAEAVLLKTATFCFDWNTLIDAKLYVFVWHTFFLVPQHLFRFMIDMRYFRKPPLLSQSFMDRKTFNNQMTLTDMHFYTDCTGTYNRYYKHLSLKMFSKRMKMLSNFNG